MQYQSGALSCWQEQFAHKVCDAAEAMAVVRSGDRVYVHSHAAEPETLLHALIQRADQLTNVHLVHLMTFGPAEYAEPQYAKSFRVQSLFIGPNVRQAVNDGRADYTPVFLSEIPGMLLNREIAIDICLIQVSPPDQFGNCSLGPSVDCTMAAIRSAKVVIAEMNERMPRTCGASTVHIDAIDKLVATSRPLPQFPISAPNQVEMSIGLHVASLVPDEATIQLGIGAIPNAVLASLTQKKDLGIHSEMLSDGVIDLIESGVINNKKKTLNPGKSMVSFIFGSQRLYDFVDGNEEVDFQPSDYINDPFVIAQNRLMTSINSALQVDLTGQVSAGSIGTMLYSGFGGQLDFVRGASRSPGGKAIIALPSTAKDGAISRITCQLSLGSGVVTTRADVHYVVTEFGIAYLHGKTLRERAKALISIAHPNFRSQLEEEASAIPWLK